MRHWHRFLIWLGSTDSGGFVRMIHNRIEHGTTLACAEGFAIRRAKKEFGLDLTQVSEVWRYGSVIRSWLLDLKAGALREMRRSLKSRPGCLTRARAGGRSWRPWIWIYRRRSLPWRCSGALSPAHRRLALSSSWPPCASSPVAIR